MSNPVRAWFQSSAKTAAMAGAALAFVFAAGTPALAQDRAPARGDLTVEEAVRIALERNLDLLSGEENIRAARGAKSVAMQGYLPSLSANLGYTRRLDSFITFGGVQFPISDGDKNSYSTTLQLTQNLIDLRALNSIKAAGRDLNATRLGQQFNRIDLALVVKQQYYALLAAQELASVSDSALALSQRELQRTQSLFELGMVAKSDVLKAQVRVSTSQLDVIRDRGNVIDARARLSRTLGQDPNDDLRASTSLTPTPVAFDSVAVFDEAARNRADLQAAKATWSAAEARVGAARSRFVPSLGGAVTYSKNDSLFKPVKDFSRSASLSLSIPFFDGVFATRGDILQARARAEQARYAYERSRLDLEVEVRSAINAARQANEGIDVARTGLESAEEDLKLSQEKYNVGSGTILDLLDAQVNLQRARQQYVAALTQARIAEAQIARARGVVP
jgi:outer membrane protein TolC